MKKNRVILVRSENYDRAINALKAQGIHCSSGYGRFIFDLVSLLIGLVAGVVAGIVLF